MELFGTVKCRICKYIRKRYDTRNPIELQSRSFIL